MTKIVIGAASPTLAASREAVPLGDVGAILFLGTRPLPDGAKDPSPDWALKTSFVDAFWTSLAWQDARWLGHTVLASPTDLFTYQELVTQIRPDWIIETGTHGSGQAIFFASICELLDHGHVVSVQSERLADPPSHPRLTYIHGFPADDETVHRVRQIVGTSSTASCVSK